jgi:hypothetical protein
MIARRTWLLANAAGVYAMKMPTSMASGCAGQRSDNTDHHDNQSAEGGGSQWVGRGFLVGGGIRSSTVGAKGDGRSAATGRLPNRDLAVE